MNIPERVLGVEMIFRISWTEETDREYDENANFLGLRTRRQFLVSAYQPRESGNYDGTIEINGVHYVIPSVEYACNTGYMLHLRIERALQQDGNWTSSILGDPATPAATRKIRTHLENAITRLLSDTALLAAVRQQQIAGEIEVKKSERSKLEDDLARVEREIIALRSFDYVGATKNERSITLPK